MVLKVTFEKAVDEDETITTYFHSSMQRAINKREVGRLILEAFKAVNKKVEDYIERGSGWIVQSIDQLDLHVTKYEPVKGCSYLPLPKKLQNKNAIINVKNTDDKCFMWSILAGLHPVWHGCNPCRVMKYESYVSELDFEGIDFPVKVEDIPSFEQLNDISINVYGYDENLSILHISKHKAERRLSLILLQGQHYCWLKDPERFFNTETKNHGRKHQCHYCLCLFNTKERRDEHMVRCENPDLETVIVPSDEDKWLQFKNYHKMQRQPYMIYADFECILRKIDTCLPDPQVSHTTNYQQHLPCGYGMAEVFGCCADKQSLGETKVYRGEDAVSGLLNTALAWGYRWQGYYDRQKKKAKLEKQETIDYKNAIECSICGDQLGTERVVEHCHLCGRYRGAAHAQCNLGYRLSRDVVVVFHNLRWYNGHLILRQLGQVAHERKDIDISVIPKGFDDYLTFSLRVKSDTYSWNLKFIDGVQFMAETLDQLVKNLKSKNEGNFALLTSYFGSTQREYLLRKGVYPYDYMDSWDKFNATCLPPKTDFQSTLTGDNISDADYQYAIEIWSRFNMRTMGDYHDLYLITYVLLLADVFENFRNVCLSNYSLDPAHYFTAPGFSWDACLKYTKVRLELLTDPDMYTFLEKGIRGGISVISRRYAKANNPLLDNFDPLKLLSYIIYLDTNNLYGWTMAERLPIKDFEWTNAIDMSKVADNSDVGYILEVDMNCPEHLHDIHNDYPLAPERLEIKDDMLSPYYRDAKEQLNVSNGKVQKLVPNLQSKTNYIVHYRNLKLYLQLGMQLTKVYRVLKFTQSPWMAPYINFNTEMRKSVDNDFEKKLFQTSQ